MRETIVNVVAASSLAFCPVAVGEASSVEARRAYIRQDDEQGNELATLIPETGNSNQDYSVEWFKKAGHFVHRLAARNNQMGHRYRADTR